MRCRFIVLLFTILALFAPLALADSSVEDRDNIGGNDDASRALKQQYLDNAVVKSRLLKIEGESENSGSAQKLGVRMYSSTPGQRDMLRFTIRTRASNSNTDNKGGAETIMSYYNGTAINDDDGSDDDGRKAINTGMNKFTLRFRLGWIVEYDPTSFNIPIFGANSNVLKTYRIGNGGWTGLTYAYNQTTSIFKATTSTTDNVFKIDARTATSIANIFNPNSTIPVATLSPNSVKFDYTISNWTYASPYSQLALVSSLWIDSLQVTQQSDGKPSQRNITMTVNSATSKDTVQQASFWWQPMLSAIRSDGTIDRINITALPLATIGSTDFDNPQRSDSNDDDTPSGGWKRQVFVINSGSTRYIKYIWDPETGVISAPAPSRNAAFIQSPSWFMTFMSVLLFSFFMMY